MEKEHMLLFLAVVLVVGLAYGSANLTGFSVVDDDGNQSIQNGGGATAVTNCTTITVSGDYYLANDITDSATSPCITIQASDVDFDGNGYTIDGTYVESSKGVYVYPTVGWITNTSIHNLTLTDWEYGLFGHGYRSSTIYNNTFSSNEYGAELEYYSSSNTFTDNYFYDNTANGLVLWGESGSCTLINNTANDNGYAGFYFGQDLGGSTLENNTVSYNQIGIVLNNAYSNELRYNTILENSGSGIYMTGTTKSYTNIIEDNVINDNYDGIKLYNNVQYTYIFNNTIHSNENAGIYLDSTTYKNYIRNSNSISENNYGIYLSGSSGNDLWDNNITANTYGYYSLSSNWNDLQNNNISDNDQEGVYFSTSHNNTISGGEIGNNNQDYHIAGVYFTGSRNNTIKEVYMHDNARGAIQLSASSLTFIERNHITENCGDERQIYASASDDVTIRDNNITDGTGLGIYIYQCDGAQILYNNISGNYYEGIYIYGQQAEDSDHVIKGNIIDDNAESCYDGSCGGITVLYEDRLLIQDNNISDNGYNGIDLYETKNSQILDNLIMRNNHFGIKLAAHNEEFGAYNNVTGNTLINNSDVGIRVGSEENRMINNTVHGDGKHDGWEWGSDTFGIYIYSNWVDAEDNYFEGNTVSGYYYGIYTDNIYNFTLNEDVHDNYYGIYVGSSNDEDNMPLISNSEVYDNCYGIYLSSSAVNIENTGFSDNIMCDTRDIYDDELYSDEFDETASGFVARKGSWEVDDGEYWGNKDGFVYGLSVYEDLELTDFAIESEVGLRTGATGTGKQAGIAFRVQEQSAIDCGDGNYKSGRYILVLDLSSQTIRIEEHSGLCDDAPGFYDAIIIGQADLSINMGDSYDVALLAKGNRFSVYVDGNKMFEAVDENNRYPSGKIGYSFRNSNAAFDQLYIYNLTGYGLYLSESHANLTNGDFLDNHVYGIYERTEPILRSVNWYITEDVTCRNNDIQISEGFIVPNGGTITATSCTITIDGEELNLSAGQQGSIQYDITTDSNNHSKVGGPSHGFEAEIYTGNSFSGDLNVKFYNQNPGGSGFGLSEIGKFIDVSPSTHIDVISWILKIYYSDADIEGLDESTLRIQYYNATSGTWTRYDPPNGGVNTTGNYVWANVTHFSVFGVGGSAPAFITVSSSGGSSSRCIPYWQCTEWSFCYDGTKTRECEDLRHCRGAPDRPLEVMQCVARDGVEEVEEEAALPEVVEETITLPVIEQDVVEEPKPTVIETPRPIQISNELWWIIYGALFLVILITVRHFAYPHLEFPKQEHHYLYKLDKAIEEGIKRGYSKDYLVHLITQKGWPKNLAERQFDKVRSRIK